MLGLLKYQQNLLNIQRAHKLSISRVKQLLSILQTLNSSQGSIMNNFMPKELNNLDELYKFVEKLNSSKLTQDVTKSEQPSCIKKSLIQHQNSSHKQLRTLKQCWQRCKVPQSLLDKNLAFLKKKNLAFLIKTKYITSLTQQFYLQLFTQKKWKYMLTNTCKAQVSPLRKWISSVIFIQ